MFTLPIEFGTPAYDQAVALRQKALLDPLQLEFLPQELQRECLDGHLACYSEHWRMLGCLVLGPEDSNQRLQIRQVAVREEVQKKGVGSALLQAAEQRAAAHGYREVVVAVHEKAQPFYQKLGYRKFGRSFTEKGIKHVRLKKALPGAEDGEE